MLRNNPPDIQGMLSAHDKRVREATGLLSRLYRLALMELSITPYRWNFLLDKRLERFAKENEVTHDMISNERSNLRKGLNEPDMTYPMFCRGIDFLDAVETHFYVTLTWENAEGVLQTVHKSVPIGGGREKEDQGDLTYLYREVLAELGKDVDNLNPDIDRYLSNPLMRSEIKGKKRGNDKGNLRRELKVNDITFDVFKKGLRILFPSTTEIGVKFRWNSRKFTTHKLIIQTPTT